MSTAAKLGPVLRRLRQRNDWTLDDLAKRSGLSTSTLSKAERDQHSLAYDKLLKLAEVFEVDISSFFDGQQHSAAEPPVSRRSITRSSDGAVVATDNYTYVYLCTELLKKKFVPFVTEVRARSLQEFGELVRHAGEEFAYVLQGAVEIHTEHYAPVILKAGDSMYFDSRMGHAYIAHGKPICRLLSICSSPESSLRESLSQHFGPVRKAIAAKTPSVKKKKKTA